MTDMCKVCNQLCKVLCKAKALIRLACAWCVRFSHARTHAKSKTGLLNFTCAQGKHPAHIAHPAHAFIYAAFGCVTRITYPYTSNT